MCPLDFPPERTVWKGRGRKGNFPMEMPDKPDLHQVIKVKSTVISHSDSTWRWYSVMTAHHFWGLSPKTRNPDLIMRKTSDKSQWRDILQNTCSAILKSAEVIKNRDTEKLLQPRGAQGDMTTTCNGVSWMEPWTRRRVLGENWVM